MPTKLRSRITYANVVSTMCLFMLLGGSAYAAVTLKTNSVLSKHIKDGQVTTKDVKNASLLAADFKAGQLPAGAQGPKGDTGSTGARGETGPPGLSDVTRRSAETTVGEANEKSQSVSCDSGETAVGGGAQVSEPWLFGPVNSTLAHVSNSYPISDTEWYAYARVRAGMEGAAWQLRVHVLCARVAP